MCTLRSILHLKVAILSRNAHYCPTSTSSTLATLSGTLANTPNPNLPAYATLWPRFFVLDGWTPAPRLVVINRDLPSPTYLIRPVMNISAWNDCLPVNYTSWLTYFYRPSSQIMQLHNSFDRFRCLLSLEIASHHSITISHCHTQCDIDVSLHKAQQYDDHSLSHHSKHSVSGTYCQCTWHCSSNQKAAHLLATAPWSIDTTSHPSSRSHCTGPIPNCIQYHTVPSLSLHLCVISSKVAHTYIPTVPI